MSDRVENVTLRLASDDYRSDQTRCDGCGELTSGATHYKEDDVFIATYCPGCEDLRRLRGIEPGEHEQFKLREAKASAD